MRIAVAMSGGVDSSVAAALLHEQGHDVIGITMKIYDFNEVDSHHNGITNCCNLEAINDAKQVARQLGIPHYVLDVRTEFENTIIQYFIDEYLRGNTPNPCVLCNKVIKMGLLLEKARQYFQVDALATGHYARVTFNETHQRFTIAKGISLEKDQSYVLWALPQDVLAKLILPLGVYTKEQVRQLAQKFKLHVATKHESFEICFVPDNRYERFLKQRVPELEAKVSGGDIIYNGKIVGKHHGYPFYTIGQRRNIGAYGQKMYVVRIESKTNRIEIGPEEALYHRALIATNVNWMSINGTSELRHGHAKVRYKDDAAQAVLSLEHDGKIRVVFDIPKRAITPGQSIVFYDGDEIVCGGIIETVVE